jgi:o-succinylbenzoate synthase
MSEPIAHIRLYPYRLPLRRTWCFGSHRLETRLGWLVAVRGVGGALGWGEASPLPQAGTEHPAVTLAWLERNVHPLEGRDLDEALQALPPARHAPPAARCGLETALLDLLARQAGQPLATRLAPAAAGSIEVNAALGKLGTLSWKAVEAALQAGFRCLKIKLGDDAPQTEAAHILALCRRLPAEIRLRLDANRSWDLASAATLLDALPMERIELVEEPLADPDPSALSALTRRCGVPLALDESLTHHTAERLLAHPSVACLVLKPMRLGGLLPCLELSRRARAGGKEVRVTGMLDATPATLATAHLAAALDAEGPPRAHGLATSGWLARDLAPPPCILAGRLHLPRRPGIGCEPYPKVRATHGH